MKYYNSQIPLALAEKLKEKGMPMQDAYTPILYDKPESVMSGYIIPSYSEVFDWLIEKGMHITIDPVFGDSSTRYSWVINYDATISVYSTWHEAAEKAIEKALTLI